MEKSKRRNKLAYIIGPFRAKTDHERIRNIRSAEAMADKLWLAGFTVICCHMNTMNMEGLIDDEEILDGDIVILERCDFCVTSLLFNNHLLMGSIGSQNEIAHCDVIGKTVYDNINRVTECEG